jgi:hypothetical protein
MARVIVRAILGPKKVDEIVKSTLFCKVRHVLYSGIQSVYCPLSRVVIVGNYISHAVFYFSYTRALPAREIYVTLYPVPGFDVQPCLNDRGIH